MEQLSKVGFIGLGNMGRPMAARLKEAGFTLTVFDSNPQAQQTFLDRHGGNGATSLVQLASNSDVVITMLPDGHVVRRVTLGEGQDRQDCLSVKKFIAWRKAIPSIIRHMYRTHGEPLMETVLRLFGF